MPVYFNQLISKLSTVCLLALTVFTLMSCANLPQDDDEAKVSRYINKPARVTIRGDAIIFKGPISEINNQKLFKAFKEARNSPTSLRITSGGGSVEAGLELGEWVLENQLNVHIPRICASSCANYVFTAGKEVTLDSTAVVFWHGSPTMDDLVAGTPAEQARRDGVEKSLQQMKPGLTDPHGYWNEVRVRNRRFFRNVGIDPVITMLSFVADESSLEKITDAASWTQYGAYISIEDMKYFGVNHVRVKGEKAWAPEKSKVAIKALIKVTLVEDVEQRLSEIKEHLSRFQ